MTRVAVVLVVAALAVSTPRASGLDTRAVDAVFAQYNRPDSPGCALGVYQNGAIAYERGYGMASLEHDAPITPKSVFYVGSVSKQFTAMAAALAIQQGKLAYEDSIRTYLPELPPYAEAIKVRHLLHHTSGLRDYNTLLSIAGRRDEDAWDNRVVLQMTARQTQLNFTPGDEYLYSNTGYTLLATIVERATGTRFAQFARDQIFKPLNMMATHYHVDAKQLVPGRALAYEGRDGQWTLDTPINERAGAGGLYTTVEDLQKWDENFYRGLVGGPDVLKTLQTRGRLNDGTQLAYAWGLEIGEYRGLPIVEHGGSLGGYRAHIMRFPAAHTTVAMTCNLGTIAPAGMARRVADVVLGGVFAQAAPSARQTGVVGSILSYAPDARAAEQYRAFAGKYYSEEVEATFEITAKDLAVFLKRETDPAPIAMEPAGGPNDFRVRGMTVRFEPDGTALRVDAGRVRGIRFVRR